MVFIIGDVVWKFLQFSVHCHLCIWFSIGVLPKLHLDFEKVVCIVTEIDFDRLS